MWYVISMIASMLAWISELVREGFNWLVARGIVLASWLGETVVDMLPSAVVEVMSTDRLKQAYAFYEFVDGLIPATEMLSIYVTGWVAVISIRIFRWIFALVPTLGG